MSRLWSRLGARTAAVALLSVGVAGGFYLGDDRETRQDPTARVGVAAEQAVNDQQTASGVQSVQQRTAEYHAKLRSAAAAEAAAERARRAKVAAASRKKAEEAAAKAAAAVEAEEEKTVSKPYDGPIPASCAEFSGNRKIGCALMLEKGFAIDQFPCLDKLWDKESGWNHKARNPSSGAYGIPQALPGSKMGSVADDWETNPTTQITWGLGYIEGRYGTPCKAWAHSQDVGWY
ncbi:lytic transglycosylase domain-containing protein [Micromonospora sp. NPDC049497]|uniref:aggregation-promoting factor C-terminal-like domain-containing protein n=1 Tax=Micromonospora sp. NPDC049497 TaxID=3364273 RepID=UPI00379AA7D9